MAKDQTTEGMNNVSFAAVTQLVDALGARGLTTEVVDAALKHPEVFDPIVKRLTMELAEQPKLFEDLERQQAQLVTLNKNYAWGFGEEGIRQVSIYGTPRYGLTTDVIAVYLPDEGGVDGVTRTFRSMLDTIRARYKTAIACVLTDPECRVVLNGTIDHYPGVRRIAINLGQGCYPHSGGSPDGAYDPDYSGHAGLLSAIMQHPKWVQSMNGVTVPYVVASGYRIIDPDGREYAPMFRWNSNSKSLGISAVLADERLHDVAFPEERPYN